MAIVEMEKASILPIASKIMGLELGDANFVEIDKLLNLYHANFTNRNRTRNTSLTVSEQ